MGRFRWNEWNVDHIGKHGVEPFDAEFVISCARRPYPEYDGNGRWMVRGQTEAGEYIQAVFVVDDDGETAYVIHARPLTDGEKRRLRRRQR
jgi:uncharacterized DUF497 family protein